MCAAATGCRASTVVLNTGCGTRSEGRGASHSWRGRSRGTRSLIVQHFALTVVLRGDGALPGPALNPMLASAL